MRLNKTNTCWQDLRGNNKSCIQDTFARARTRPIGYLVCNNKSYNKLLGKAGNKSGDYFVKIRSLPEWTKFPTAVLIIKKRILKPFARLITLTNNVTKTFKVMHARNTLKNDPATAIDVSPTHVLVPKTLFDNFYDTKRLKKAVNSLGPDKAVGPNSTVY